MNLIKSVGVAGLKDDNSAFVFALQNSNIRLSKRGWSLDGGEVMAIGDTCVSCCIAFYT